MSNADTNIPTPRTDAAKLESQKKSVALSHTFDGWRFAYQLERELAQAKAALAAARKDSERLKWLFSGYAVCRWENGEVSMPDSDKIMYSMFDLDDDMKAATEGGER